MSDEAILGGLLLSTLVVSLATGGAVGLVLWHRRPEAVRNHPVEAMLPWIGLVLGSILLRDIAVLIWMWPHV